MAPQPDHHQPGIGLVVQGAVPPGLSGRLTAVGDGLIHSVDLTGGRVTHLVRPIRTPGAVRDLCAVDGSVLARTDIGAVVELSPTGASRLMDLAGRGHVAVTGPLADAHTGELHLIARDAFGDHEHVAVSAGRLTRRSRSIDHAPDDIRGIALTRGHLVVAADGAIGILHRSGNGSATWMTTEAAAPVLVHAHDSDGDVELVVLAPSLERWILRAGSTAVSQEVLDAAPKRFARSSSAAGDVPTSVWTAGGHLVTRHDIGCSRTIQRDLEPDAPGDFVLVPDDAGSSAAGWFIGLVRDTDAAATQVHLIGADDPAMQPLASFRLPQRLSLGVRCTWTPHAPASHPTDQNHTQEHPS